MKEAASGQEGFLAYENNEKPNRIAAKTMRFVLIIHLVLWALNEVGIFTVPLGVMRVATVLDAVLIIAILLLIRNRSSVPSTKYVVMGLMMALLLVSMTALYFHVVLALILPLIIATEYHDLKISRGVLIGSAVIALVSPALGLLLGTWDTAYFSAMLSFGGADIVSSAEIGSVTFSSCLRAMLYLGLPTCIILVAISAILLEVAKAHIDRIDVSTRILDVSEKDELTGLLNSASLRNAMDLQAQSRQAVPFYCVSFSVDGLQAINARGGYAAGNDALVTVAQQISAKFGLKDSYRVGGSQFVCFSYSSTENEVDILIADLERFVRNSIDCTLYSGVAASDGKLSMKDALMESGRALQENVHKAQKKKK